MAGVGNITRIEMDYMNAMIALSRAYRDSQKLVKINPLRVEDNNKSNDEVFIPKNKIISIISYHHKDEDFDFYYVKTDSATFRIDKEQGDKLIKEW